MEPGSYRLRVSVDENQNYKEGQAEFKIEIRKAALRVRDLYLEKKVYDGTKEVRVREIYFENAGGTPVPLKEGTDYRVIFSELTDENAGADRSAVVKFSLIQSAEARYVLTEGSFVKQDVSVEKAVSGALETELRAEREKAQTFKVKVTELPGYPVGGRCGAKVTLKSSTEHGIASVAVSDDGQSLMIVTRPGSGEEDAVKAEVSSDNYENFVVAIKLHYIGTQMPPAPEKQEKKQEQKQG